MIKTRFEQPVRAFSARQLQEIGCGDDATIRRRYAYLDHSQLVIHPFKNKKTRFYPFHLLTEEDQARVLEWELHQDLARLQELANATRTAAKPESLSEIPVRPRIFHTPAEIAGAEAARRVKEQEALSLEECRQRKEELMAMYQALPESAKCAARAKHDMLTACRTFLKTGGYKGRVKEGRKTWNTKGLKAFCRAFVEGTLELPPETAEFFTRKGKRSLVPASLINWRNLYEEQNLYGLADHYVSKAGATTLTEVQQNFVIGMIHDHPHINQAGMLKALKARFRSGTLPSKHSVGRFMQHWKETHKSLYLYITNPDEWRSRHMFAFGDASEDVLRLNQRWEADSTKADLMCTDGRCVVIGIIDVWPRKFKLHVSPTSKATAIAALYRRCLLDWGTPEELRTDCGSDYTSFHLERVCDALDVHHHLCNEFHPEEKPHIERAFKTFSHDLVELLPGYVGHSVAERKNIEARKSFASRLMTKGETVEVKLTMAELQDVCDRWAESIYHQNPHKSLNGMTPAAKARSWTQPIRRITNERALDVLLSPAPSQDGWRTITKKGISVVFNGVKLDYKAGEFAGHEGKRCQVLIDETDLGRASVFLDNGQFLCVAEDPRWYGISNQEIAQHAKKEQKRILAEQKKAVKRLAKQADTRNVAAEILKSREEQTAKIAEMPKKAEEYSTPALEQAAAAVEERDRKAGRPTGTPISEEVIKRTDEMIHRKGREMPMNELDIAIFYERRIKEGTATAEQIEYVEAYRHYEDTGKRIGPLAVRRVA